jgi:excisionase family DNA binding protein
MAEAGRILYSRKEAAEKLSISLRNLCTIISRGEIRVRRVGGRTLISHRELERFAEGEQAA